MRKGTQDQRIKLGALQKTKAKEARPARRSLDTKRLFRKRKAPTILVIEDRNAIRVNDNKTITAAGLTLPLAKALPEGTDIHTVTIVARRSSRAKGRNRPMRDRSYDVRIHIQVPDAEDKVPWDNPTAVDVGLVNKASLTTGQHLAHPKVAKTENALAVLRKQQKRLKYKGRQWQKLQKQIRTLLAHRRHVIENWEQHVAKEIAETHTLLGAEDLKHSNLRRSAKGTNENPGSRIAQKAGLNRGWASSRSASLVNTIERQCEKNGTWFLKLDPKFTSQTCPLCGCRAKENRKSQAEFLCQRCHLSAHADTVAAANIATAALKVVTLMLLLWAHGPDKESATIRRRQGLPPLNASLTLLAGRPGRPLDPSGSRDRQGYARAGGPRAFQPKLSI